MHLNALSVRAAVLTLGLLLTSAAMASEEAQLIDSINAYRSQAQSCDGKGTPELPPLHSDPRLLLPVDGVGDLQAALAAAAYPMMNVQAISLSGPRDAQSAMQALRESFCRVLLDPQFIDIGINRDIQVPSNSRFCAWMTAGTITTKDSNTAGR